MKRFLKHLPVALKYLPIAVLVVGLVGVVASVGFLFSPVIAGLVGSLILVAVGALFTDL